MSKKINFYDQIMKKPELKGKLLSPGAKIEILNEANSHNYGPRGTIQKIRTDGIAPGLGSSSVSAFIAGGNSLNFRSFRLITEESKEALEEAIQELKEEKAKLNREILLKEEKLNVLEEIGEKELTDSKFRAHMIVKISSDAALTSKEKAEKIADILEEE